MSRVELRRLWEGRIRTFRASGQSAVAWCDEQNLIIHQFRYWMRRLSPPDLSSSTPVRWLSVDVHETPPPVQSATSQVTVCVGAWRVEVPNDFSPLTLQRVVQALAELC